MTKEEFVRLSQEWEAIEFYLSQDGTDFANPSIRQLDIERLMESSPWEFDDDGKVIARSQEQET